MDAIAIGISHQFSIRVHFEQSDWVEWMQEFVDGHETARAGVVVNVHQIGIALGAPWNFFFINLLFILWVATLN